MRQKWWLKSISIFLCAMFLCGSLPVRAEEEQIKVSEKEYAVTLNEALNLFISNKEAVSGEVGSKVFLTYTVESVTKNAAIQSGVIGTMDNMASFPYVDVGRMYLSEGSLLYDEGYTYVFRFERTETGFEYQCAKLKGDEAERIIFASSTALPVSGEENYKYYGTWIGGAMGDVVSAVLNHVRCYDEDGNDLGVNVNTASAINHNDMNELLGVHPIIDSSYSFKLENVNTLAMSNKYPTDSDVVYMEYEVENIVEDSTYQQGAIITSAPYEMYPHANNRGLLMVEIYEKGKGETPLLKEGGKYFVCFKKNETGFECVVQCTRNGETETFSFTGNSGTYNKEFQYFSLWYGEGQGYNITADFKNVKCYDAEGNSLGIQLNKTTVPISHRGGLEDYTVSQAVYYCQENGGIISLEDGQTYTSTHNGVKEEGDYTIQDDTALYLLAEEGKIHYEFAHLSLTDDEGNIYKRLKDSTVTFVTGDEVIKVKAEAANGYRVAEPEAPTKKNNTFKGWYLGDETAFNFDTVISESITLYAKWQDGDGNEYLATMGEISNKTDTAKTVAIAVSLVIVLGSAVGCVVIARRRKHGKKA